ncbi:MAG: hypothetical protein L3J74_13935 [Bacteroidales bacterium]|nr:hypothetical protein [Bacteroidales bacterium]
MNKKNIVLFIALIFLSNACGNNSQNNSATQQKPNTNQKLHIEDYDFSVYGNNKFIPYNKAIYQRGDDVYFVLKNVGPFARGKDSLNRAEMKMEILDAISETIAFKNNLFGERGHADFDNNLLKQPYASYSTDSKDKIGKYTFKITVYDLVRGDSTSVSDDFYIE